MLQIVKTVWKFIILPLTLAFFAFYLLQAPRYSGSLQILPSKYNPITIKRDESGVPSIESKTFRDTMYGYGYAQAQDRLWGLHSRRLLMSGRLSELAGEKALHIDKFFRNIGLRRYSQYVVESLDEESLSLIEAFVDGINDYVANTKILPLEFWITGSKFEPYTILDSVNNLKFISFFLTFDFQFEFMMDTLGEIFGEDKVADIMPYKGEKLFWNDTVVLNDDELKQAGLFQEFREDNTFVPTTPFEFPEERRPPKVIKPKVTETKKAPEPTKPAAATPTTAQTAPPKATPTANPSTLQKPTATDAPKAAPTAKPATPQKPTTAEAPKAQPTAKPATPQKPTANDLPEIEPSSLSPPSKKQVEQGAKEEKLSIPPESQTGSNSWVVHGSLTSTGKPILANDPHLMNGIPSVWYPASLFYEDNYVSGAGLVGSASISIGRSKYVSWGITTLLSDTSDLYVLQIQDNKYLYEGEWYPLKEFKEQIHVKGQSEPVEVTFYESHHGVLIDYYFADIFSTRNFKPKEGQRYSLAWSGYVKNDRSPVGFVNLMNSKNSNDVINAFRDIPEPAFSLLFATDEGDIGFLGTGRIPIRKNPRDGITPRDGSLQENDWLGFVPWEDQPKIVNPKKGYIVSANNKMASDNIKWHTSANMMTNSRAARIDEMIKELIAKNKKITVEDMIEIQSDTLDVLARDVTPVMIGATRKGLNKGYPLTVTNDKLALLLEKLEGWDYKAEKDSIPATIFNVWERFFARKMLRKIGLSNEDFYKLITNMKFDHFLFRHVMTWRDRITPEEDFFCFNDENTGLADPCLYNLVKSLEETWTYLEKTLGPDVEDWKWSAIHRMDYPHGTFSPTALRSIFHRLVPGEGNGRTVNVARMKMESDSFLGVWSPNLKMVVSMDEGDQSYFVIDTGVSESAFSQHYDDQMQLVVEGKYLPLTERRKTSWKDALYLQPRSS